MGTQQRHAKLGTLVVIIHAVVLTAHSLAHLQLDILLGPAGNLFVALVIVAAPLVAAVLLWTRFQAAGTWLLLASMLGSFVFGVYNHFVVHSPDHVSQVPTGTWGTIFTVSAILMAVVEAWGCQVAIREIGARSKRLSLAREA